MLKIKKIKVCQVSTIPFAIRFLLLDQIKNLQKEGYEVSAVCSPGKWIKEIEENNIPVKPITMTRKISPFTDLITLFKLINYFKKQKFDIVHTSTPKAGFLGTLAAKIAGVPVVIHSNLGFYFQKDSHWIKKKFFVFIERITAICSDLVFSVAKPDIQTALKEKICQPEKIKYMGWWINLEKFNPNKFSQEFIEKKKKSLGIAPETKVIGINARLVKDKGYYELFRSFKQLLKENPNTILLIIGPEEPKKRDRINPALIFKRFGIEKNVLYLGERIDVDELYSLMDIFVLPSYREGVAVSVLEALAMERPVIATDVGGIPDSVENGKTGVLIPPKNIKELTEKLILFLDNIQEIKKFGIEGRKKIKEQFNEQIVFSRIKNEYQRLIKEKIRLKIKICHVVNADMTLKFMMENKLKILKNQGYDVYTVCSQGNLIGDIRKSGIKVKTINFTRNLNLFTHLVSFFRLWSYFRKEKFDIVHTHTPVPGFLGQLAAKITKTPIIINTIHGFYFGEQSGFTKRKFYILIEKISAKCSDLIFSVSQGIIETAVQKKIAKRELFRYLGRDIDTDRFNMERFSQDFISNKKKDLAIASNLRIIGIVGRLVEEKGYLELFEAFARILKQFPKTLLLVIGPRESQKRDRIDPSIVRKFGIERNVLFLGQRVDVDELYSLMDIFVLPSYREGIASSLLEACSMEKPVIFSNIKASEEVVNNRETGLIVATKDVDALTRSLIFLFKNPEKAKQMGRNGRRKILKEFNKTLTFKRMITEYNCLINEKL